MSSSTSVERNLDMEETKFELDSAHEPVTFEDIQDHYHPNEDIFVIYQLSSNCLASSKDWVGLYKADWVSTDDYVTYEWAPKVSRNDKFPHLRSVLFQAQNIEVEPSVDEKYQFLYVNKFKQVVGKSRHFCIHDNPLFSLACVERPLDGVSDLTFIESQPKSKAASLETFEIVQTWSDESNSSEEAPISASDHMTLLEDFNQSESDILDIIAMAMREDMDDEVEDEDKKKLGREKTEDANLEQALVPYVPITASNVQTSQSLVPIYSASKGAVEDLMTGMLDNNGSHNVQFDSIITAIAEAVQRQAVCPSPRPAILQPEVIAVPARLTKKIVPSSCKSCKRRRAQGKMLRKKIRQQEGELESVRLDLELTEDVMDLKSFVLEEVGREVKDLVREKESLLKANCQIAQDNRKLQGMMKQNRKLLASVTTATAVSDELKLENLVLTSSNTWFQEMLKSAQQEKNECIKEKEEIRSELESALCHQKELQEQFDDIMYTLSLKGVSKVIDSNGNPIHMKVTSSNPKVMELEGWTIARNRKTERHLATIAAHEMTIADLEQKCNGLNNNIKEMNHKIEQLENSLLESERATAQARADLITRSSEVNDETKKSEALMRMLVSEKQMVSALQQQMASREQQLKDRINSLINVAHANRLLHKQTEEKLCQTQALQTSSRTSQADIDSRPGQIKVNKEKVSQIKADIKAKVDEVKAKQEEKSTLTQPKPINGRKYFGARPKLPSTEPLMTEVSTRRLSSDQPIVSQPAFAKEENGSIVSASWAMECEKLEADNTPLIPNINCPDPDKVSLRPTSPLIENARKDPSQNTKKQPRKFHFQVTGPGHAAQERRNMELMYTPRMYSPKPRAKPATRLNHDSKRKY